MTYSDKETEKRLIALEKKIAREYQKAYKEVTKKANDYFSAFEKRDEAMRRALEEGNYPELFGASYGMTPEEHYRAWRMAQIGRGTRWQSVQAEIAKKITSTNEEAAKLINGETTGIYILNHNYDTFMLESAFDGYSFPVYNEENVADIIGGENHSEFRVVSINPKRDYEWNTKKIQTSLASSIIQGKSLKEVTDAFMHVMGTNRTAAIRNARTAMTSAQNSGHAKAYKEASEMGIDILQEWISTHDGRTRDSHIHMDGVRIVVGEKFPNGLSYPGDPTGAPAEVYNCRCTMRAILPKRNGELRTNNTVESYNKWLNRKESTMMSKTK